MISFKKYWRLDEDFQLGGFSSDPSSISPASAPDLNMNSQIAALNQNQIQNQTQTPSLSGENEADKLRKEQEKAEKSIKKLREKRDSVINSWNNNKGTSSNVSIVNYDDKGVVGITLIVNDPVLKHFEKDLIEKMWKDEIFVRDLASTFAEYGIVMKIKNDLGNYYAKLIFKKDEKKEEEQNQTIPQF